MIRCPWCLGDPLYIRYHDEEWGTPVYEDRKLFEFLVLEGAQAGLSWLTVLKKREHYRLLYAGFDPLGVADFTPEKVETMLADPGIIRNRKKIEFSIANARLFIKIQQEFGSFGEYIWRFVGGRPRINHWQVLSDIPARTADSEAISVDLRKRGFSFVGSTIIYAHMQATGMVNDHLIDCFRHRELRGGAEQSPTAKENP